MKKKRIAVCFGGRSPEHDVSIVTGLQVLNALGSDRFEGIAVYAATNGEWFIGNDLGDRATYLPSAEMRRKLIACRFASSADGGAQLIPEKRGLFGGSPVTFDVALLAFHGAIGEDGCVQGLMETAGIPYTGMRVFASSVAMDKIATKAYVNSTTSARQLPFVAVRKMDRNRFSVPALPDGWKYPVIVKPAHLGSSIGVARAANEDEMASSLKLIFLYDTAALIEPYIAHRREYNIAVRRYNGEVQTSAIEMPKSMAELLDFKEKYVSSGGVKKTGGTSEGMLSLTRELNPAVEPKIGDAIRQWASEIFLALNGTGVPRLDFIHDEQSGDLWFNEINPCPGSFGYFLWEASLHRVLFSEMLEHLIDEAELQKTLVELPVDPVPPDARLFGRH